MTAALRARGGGWLLLAARLMGCGGAVICARCGAEAADRVARGLPRVRRFAAACIGRRGASRAVRGGCAGAAA